MALNIPNRLQDVVLDIFAMEPSERSHIIDVLTESVEPGSNRIEYQRKLTEILDDKSPEWIDRALDFIFSITNLTDTGRGFDAIANDLTLALRRTNDESVKNADSEDFEEFKAFIVKLARSQDTLGLGAKASRISLQHERIFVFSEVLSDIRGIFSEDVSVPPKSAVIVHSLKVHSHRDDRHDETYFAMDYQDLVKLRKVVDRAITKHETLSEMMNEFGVRVIELGGDEQ